MPEHCHKLQERPRAIPKSAGITQVDSGNQIRWHPPHSFQLFREYGGVTTPPASKVSTKSLPQVGTQYQGYS